MYIIEYLFIHTNSECDVSVETHGTLHTEKWETGHDALTHAQFRN